MSQGALAAAGISEPTPVQLEAIPQILRGVDAAVQSYTGSGKVSFLDPDCSRWITSQTLLCESRGNIHQRCLCTACVRLLAIVKKPKLTSSVTCR